MAQNSQDPSGFLKQMYDMQQVYMKNMGQMFSPPPPVQQSNPFEHWWTQMSQTAQPNAMNAQNPFANSTGTNDWFGNMNQQFQQWMTASKPTNPLMDNISQQFTQQMTAPFSASMFTPPQNSLDPFNLNQHLNSQVINLMQQLFVSEEKRQGEKLLGSLQQYQNVMLQYNHMMAKVGIDSLDKLKLNLGNKSEFDLEKIYENWMDISQEVYKEEFYSQDGEVLGEQLNKVQDQLSEDYETYRQALAKNFGFASISDVEDLQQQINDLKSQLEKLQA